MVESDDIAWIFDKFPKDEILSRYRSNYNLGCDIDFSAVEKHAYLERYLTTQLLKSTPDNRFEVFHAAYARLYAELPWLTGNSPNSGAEVWLSLLRPRASVYEVGSGAGYLINFLADHGLICVGTDISADRATVADQRERKKERGLSWETTDGVHLSRFAKVDTYDYVISDQLVEHLHPDDIISHLSEARKLLKAGGEYLLRTPYAPLGPQDLSLVFGLDSPIFMHLHEYGSREIARLGKKAGFQDVRQVFVFPSGRRAVASRLYTGYMNLIDQMLYNENSRTMKSIIKRYRKMFLVRNNVFVSMTK